MKNEFTYEHEAPNRAHVVLDISFVSVLKDGGKQSVGNTIISYLLKPKQNDIQQPG